MFKKLLLTMILILSMSTIAKGATGTLKEVSLYTDKTGNDKDLVLQCYEILGDDYFRARDIFKLLDFNIEAYSNGIAVNSGQKYKSTKSIPKLTIKNINIKLDDLAFKYDGSDFEVTGFNYDGNNFYRLDEISPLSIEAVWNHIIKAKSNIKPEISKLSTFYIEYETRNKLKDIYKRTFDLTKIYEDAQKTSKIILPTDKPFSIILNNTNIEFKNKPYVKNNTIMVSIEDITNAMGMSSYKSYIEPLAVTEGVVYTTSLKLNGSQYIDVMSSVSLNKNILQMNYVTKSSYFFQLDIPVNTNPEIKHWQLFVPLEILTLVTDSIAYVDTKNYTVNLVCTNMGLGTDPEIKLIEYLPQ